MQVSVIAAGMVAALVGFGSTLAIVLQAAHALGATPGQAASWVTSLCLAMAASSLIMSWRHRMPIVSAWSLAGAVLIAATPPGTDMAAGTGAFVFAAVLMLLGGAVPALGAAIARLPAPVGAAMLAGLLLRFVLDLFRTVPAAPLLVVPLLAVFLLARRVHPASAVLVVIAAGLALAPLVGMPVTLPAGIGLPRLEWIAPRFDPQALIGIGLPLFLVTMATQQVPGFAVLRVSGYTPPVRSILVVTGLCWLLTAPFGGFSNNLSSVTASICTGPDAHPDPARRWMTGPVYAACYLVLAVCGAASVALFTALPVPLVRTVAGLALLSPLAGATSAAFLREEDRLPSAFAFGVTASGLSLFGIGSAFWGLVAGLVVLAMERRPVRRVAPAE